jgi:putative transposase
MTTSSREGFMIRNQTGSHFMTFTVCGWIDLFTRKIYRDIVLESFTYCRENKGLNLYAYVIMSNHLHLIVSTKEGFLLRDFVRDFKAFTHRQMIKIIDSEVESRRLWMLHQFAFYASRHKRNEKYQIWVQGSHPEECITQEFTKIKLDYIHQNPVRAGFVRNAEDYLYSSASNYAMQTGLIDIDYLY